MPSLRFAFAPLLAASLMPSALFAVDGVILIDQNKALAGNVTPGDTPGFPVTISQPGSYRLDGNLTVPDANTDVIRISVNNVTIDLNGFSILGANICTPRTTFGITSMSCTASGRGNGIVADGSTDAPTRNITIRNGAIQGMGSIGISLSFSINVLVESVTEASSGYAGMSLRNAIVKESTVASNGSVGLLVNDSIVDRVVVYQHFAGGQAAAISADTSRIVNCLIKDNDVGLSLNLGSFTGNVMYGNSTDVSDFQAINMGQNYCVGSAGSVCPGAMN